MKTYSTAATARRALKTALAKINLALSDIVYEIVQQPNGGFANIVRVPDDIFEALRDVAAMPEPADEAPATDEAPAEPTAENEATDETPDEEPIPETPKRSSGYINERSRFS